MSLEKRRGLEGEIGELTDYLSRSLCLCLDRAITEIKPTDRLAFTALRLKRFVEEHATLTFKLEEAASHVGLSLSRAVKLFKEYYGKTMIQYALEIRLNATVERIKYSTMTLEEIAETCGFASYPTFTGYSVPTMAYPRSNSGKRQRCRQGRGRRRAHAKFFLLYNGVAKAPRLIL